MNRESELGCWSISFSIQDVTEEEVDRIADRMCMVVCAAPRWKRLLFGHRHDCGRVWVSVVKPIEDEPECGFATWVWPTQHQWTFTGASSTAPEGGAL